MSLSLVLAQLAHKGHASLHIQDIEHFFIIEHIQNILSIFLFSSLDQSFLAGSAGPQGPCFATVLLSHFSFLSSVLRAPGHMCVFL
jgi:hypothetical protein